MVRFRGVARRKESSRSEENDRRRCGKLVALRDQSGTAKARNVRGGAGRCTRGNGARSYLALAFVKEDLRMFTPPCRAALPIFTDKDSKPHAGATVAVLAAFT